MTMKIMKRAGLLVIPVILICCGVSAWAQATKPCEAKPEYRQFDFWIGEWEVTVQGQPAGTNRVELILDKCVLLENWIGSKGGVGKSFNIYNAAASRWQQTWVDNGGNVLEFTGEFRDGAMRFRAEMPGPNGGKTLMRMTFFPQSEDRIRQLWESSTDDGKTWRVSFDGLYSRKKSAGAPGK